MRGGPSALPSVIFGLKTINCGPLRDSLHGKQVYGNSSCVGESSMPGVGDVVEIPLSGKRHAFGRVLKDASIAVYDMGDSAQESPPIGSRDYLFVVGIREDSLRGLTVVARDESAHPDEDWPPPYKMVDVVSGEASNIYYRGEVQQADNREVDNLEAAAVWETHHIVERIEAVGPN